MTRYHIGDKLKLKEPQNGSNIVIIMWINTDGRGMYWYTIADEEGYEHSITDSDVEKLIEKDTFGRKQKT